MSMLNVMSTKNSFFVWWNNH